MKTLIFGAGPLGSLYAYLLHKAGNDVTILARNEHYKFLKENGIVLVNEFTQERIIEKVNVVDSLSEEDSYELVIVLIRKNSLKNVLPVLSKNKKIPNFLFMGNNTQGFDEYLNYLPKEKVLFGFPGGGGSRIDRIVHYVDTEKPNGKRLPITIGEIDGETKERTKQIQHLFETSDVPVSIVEDMDSWLKYHVAMIIPIAGALLKCGDNYKLANDKDTIRTYIRAVKEGGRVLKTLGYKKRYPFKYNLFYWMHEEFLVKVLKQFFSSKFVEIAFMMHVNAAKDEMIELGNEFKTLTNQTSIKTPNLDELISCILSN
ncbi:MAG: ketopantoate reductase family protein [Candidatus Kariarchaeaceae archaeon]|jgi:2-dehydropantoate 2-reductase